MIWRDPIVDEVHAIRDELAKRFNYDVTAIGEHLMARQRARKAAAARKAAKPDEKPGVKPGAKRGATAKRRPTKRK